MTALLFYIEPDQLCVAMDTRTLEIDDATNDRDLGPFCSKMLVVPHLQGLICGTGVRALPFRWHDFVQQRTVARDIADLDGAAALTLPGLARECGVNDEHTATIYHFGYSPTAETFVGRAFRSSDGFAPEALEVPSFGFKPPDGIDFPQALTLCEDLGLPNGMIEVMRLQKAIDDAKPPNQRVGIGGEVQLVVMTPDQCTMTTCHRFEDYEQDLSALLERARRGS